MPEIKNTFTQGKMNKDLDERLVPSGQYRDAMNIQLSTSDGSDIGALENVLGNDNLMGVIPYYDSSCVGSIVDDKNNSLYWLVAGHGQFKVNTSNKDMILQYKDSVVTPVVVDIWRIVTGYGSHDDALNTLDFNTLDPLGNPYVELSEVEVGMVVNAVDNSTSTSFFINNPVTNVTPPDAITGIVTVTLQDSFNIGVLNPASQLGTTFEFSKLGSKQVLNFDKTRLITGINILDDFLMFTDNFSEPKKLSIQRCISGSDGFFKNTKLVVSGRNLTIGSNILLEEQHITVIKKAPLTPLIINPKFDIPTTAVADVGLDQFYFFNSTSQANELKSPGDVITVTFNSFANGIDWEVNDEIRFLTGPGQLPQDFQVRAKVAVNLGSGQYTLIILSVDSDTPLPVAPSTASETYDVYKTPTESPLFERKFPRFSYRYKYEDGEYSTYAPFTDVVFEANSFEYDSKLAYNRGMENFIESLEIRDFIKKDFRTNKNLIPDDVVQIDILYKESDSPTIYVVDKIKYLDGDGDIDAMNILGTAGNLVPDLNNWNANLYKVNNDIIYSVVPSNQLLRPYDNVPRVALGQEITGNRLVFANYLQNFNLPIKPRVFADYDSRYDRSFNGGSLVEYSLDFIGNSTDAPHIIKKDETRSNYKGLKTLKSIRDYQIGITYLDEYGRETPVFSSSESNFYVKKKHAQGKSKIVVNAQTDAPGFAKGFKFYVKETDNRYYNLAMDRVYRAEDGNLWLSFPSSERNKVDEDTFLHLKKEIDSNSAVVEDAKYKIVSISNEAPLFIKTETKAVGSSSPGDTADVLSTSPPVIGNRYFEIDEDTWVAGNNTPLIDVLNKMSLDFLADGFYSKRYKIVNFSYTAVGGINGGGVYKVTLDRAIDAEDQWIYPNFPTVLANNLPDFNTSLSLRVYQDIVENKSEHEGKFFVKINGDGVTEDRLIGVTTSISEYEVRARMNTYMFGDSDSNYANGNTTTGNTRSVTEDQWEDVLDVNNPQDGVIDSEWFLDSAYYPMVHPSISGDKDSGNHVGDGNQNGGFGRGIQQETSGAMRWYMELSFSQLQPDMSDDQPFLGARDGNQANPCSMNYMDINSNYIWDVGRSSNPPHQNEAKIVNCLMPDSKFRFTGDTAADSVYGTDSQIYTITDVQVIRRYNHTRWGMYDREDGNGLADIRTGSANPDLHGITNDGTSTQPNGWNGLAGTRDGLAGPYFYFRFWKNDIGAFLDQDWDNPVYLQFNDFWKRFMGSLNRRTTYRIYLDKDPTTSSSFNVNGNTFTNPYGWGDAGVSGTNNAAANIASATVAQGIEFLQERITEQLPLVSENPAIWETEPKDSIDLNIYHAASQVYPVSLDTTNNYSYVPKGSILTLPGNTTALFKDYSNTDVDTILVGWFDQNFTNTGVHIALNHKFDEVLGSTNTSQNQILKFTRHDNSYTTLQFDGKDRVASLPYQDASMSLPISVHIYKILPNVTKNQVGLSWFNAFSFSNGVESNTVRDIFNEKFIDKGPIVSTTLDTTYEEERRSSGLIYSGIYNTNSGVNNLNQFIQAEKITKDLNPTYGSIQKLFSRNTDLIALCEDRVIRIQANKDAIFNADGNPQLVASNRVLGQTMPFSGDYGISKNPESFAVDNYRAYFTDKQRSAVLRLSKDGITPISDYGMSDWFGDHIKQYNTVIGSFDSDKGNYNLTLKDSYSAYGTSDFTISYNENVKGWVSFKSFIPENGVSLSNNYYTFKTGYLYVHHVDYVDRNTFYGDFANSSVDVLLNAEPGSVKNYQTLNYEGSASLITAEVVPLGIDSNEYQGYKNLVSNKGGWYTSAIITDQQQGHVNEYKEKEGKWFNYIKGNTVINNMDIKTEEFSFQGIGKASSVPPPVLGCTNPAAIGYDPLANVDDGSCVLPIRGCCDPLANNNQNLIFPNICDSTYCLYDDSYDCDTVNGGIVLILNGTGTYTGPTALADATSACPACIGAPGCTNVNSSNYDPLAVCDDGSCIPCIYGCTNGTIGAPYLPDVDGWCFDSTNGIGGSLGGITPSSNGLCDVNEGYTVNNYDPSATCDDGTCVTGLLGCTDATALNFNILATVDDGSCTYCTTPCCGYNCANADMWHPDVNGDCVDGTNVGYPNLTGCGQGNGYGPENYDPNCNTNCTQNCDPPCIYGCTDPQADNYYPGSQVDDGSCIYMGCMDPTALNSWLLTYTGYYGQTPPAGAISIPAMCCGGSYTNPLYCSDCTMLNFNLAATLPSGPSNLAGGCIDNTLCTTPTTPVMDYDSNYQVSYSAHSFNGGPGWSGNPFVHPKVSDLWGSMDFTNFLVGLSSSALIGDGSNLVYYPDNGTAITVLNANGNQNAKDKIYNLLTQPLPFQSGGATYLEYATIADIHHLPTMAPNNSGTDLVFSGNGTCVESYDIFTAYGLGQTSNPGNGTMVMILERDMTNYNTVNNCNVANIIITDSFDIRYGCMQVDALNYDPNANIADCSCYWI